LDAEWRLHALRAADRRDDGAREQVAGLHSAPRNLRHHPPPIPISASENLRVLYTAPDCGIGVWRHFAFVLWQSRPTAESVRALERTYVQLGKELADGFWVLGVIEAGVAQPEAAERDAIGDAMNAAGKQLRGTATVLEATGFLAATIRGALGAMVLLTRSQFPRAFVGSLREAAAWMKARAPGVDDPKVLVERFEEMRADVRARTGR
jgi:hypothetical protein